MMFANICVFAAEKAENIVEPRASYYEYWTISSKSGPTREYGNWESGDSVTGPDSLTYSISKEVGNTYSGSLKVSYADIEVSIGVDLNWSDTRTSSFPLSPPDGETWEAQFRDKYDKYTIKQQKIIHMDGKDYPQNEYEYVYPMEWIGFDWRHVVID